jgi:UDP-glucose 4-epimerase
MKYLVTGGAGFIGSHVCDALIARGDSVVVLDNLSTGVSHNLDQLVGNPSFDFISGSILDVDLVNQIVDSVDHVLHFAAAVGVFTIVDKPLESLTTNLRGTENILEAASKYGKPVLVASSSEIYGSAGTDGVPLHEESDRIVGSPLKSRWSYSEAKAIDESLAIFYHHEKGLPVRLVRFFNTVGPRQVGSYGMVVPRFVDAALHGTPLAVYGTGNQSRCFCHIADAVAAVLALIDSDAAIGQVFNVGNSYEITIGDLAKKVVHSLGSKSLIEMIPYEVAYAPGFEDMKRRVPDISKIEAVIGWKPTRDLDVVISDIAEFLKHRH